MKDSGDSKLVNHGPLSRRAVLKAGAMFGMAGGLFLPTRALGRLLIPSAFAVNAAAGDFTLPTGCGFAAPAEDRAPGFRVWKVACSTNRNQARQYIGTWLASQGWLFCGMGLAKAAWVKNGILTTVHESSLKPGADQIVITQRTATLTDCN